MPKEHGGGGLNAFDLTLVEKELGHTSLALAEILLLSGLDATDNTKLCSVIAGFLHFLFLATFAWMLVEGIHVYYMLVKVFIINLCDKIHTYYKW